MARYRFYLSFPFPRFFHPLYNSRQILTDRVPLCKKKKTARWCQRRFSCGPGTFSGGRWFSTPRRKRGGDDDKYDSQSIIGNNCTEKVDVNVFGHASDAYGAWKIRAKIVKDAFASLHAEFQSLASHEKTLWLQAQGAVYGAPPDHGPWIGKVLACCSFFDYFD